MAKRNDGWFLFMTVLMVVNASVAAGRRQQLNQVKAELHKLQQVQVVEQPKPTKELTIQVRGEGEVTYQVIGRRFDPRGSILATYKAGDPIAIVPIYIDRHLAPLDRVPLEIWQIEGDQITYATGDAVKKPGSQEFEVDAKTEGALFYTEVGPNGSSQVRVLFGSDEEVRAEYERRK